MSEHGLPQWSKPTVPHTGSIWLGVLHMARKRIAWMILCAIVIASLFRAHQSLPQAFRHDSMADVFNGTLGVRMSNSDARNVAKANCIVSTVRKIVCHWI